MEKPKKEIKEDMSKSIEVEAAELLSKIERIVKGEKLELSVVGDIKDLAQRGEKIEKDLKSSLSSYNGLLRAGNGINKEIDKLTAAAKDLGVPIPKEIKGFTEMASRFISNGEALGKVISKFS